MIKLSTSKYKTKTKTKNTYRNLLSPDPTSKVPHSEKQKALIKEIVVDEKTAFYEIAKTLLKSKKPVIFSPGRIILWAFEEGATKKAKTIRKFAKSINAEVLPVMDIRPEFPMAKTAVEINPYHIDLIINHNKYDTAVFIGIDCPYADVALKIIKDGTKCYTIALCGNIGHVDSTITMRDINIEKLNELTEIVDNLKLNASLLH